MSKWVIFEAFPPLAAELDENHSPANSNANNEAASQWIVPESLYPPTLTPSKGTNAPSMTSLLRSTTSKWRTIDKLQVCNKSGIEEGDQHSGIESSQMDTLGMSAHSQARATQRFDLRYDVTPRKQEHDTNSQVYDDLVGLSHSQGCASNPFLVTDNLATEVKHVQFNATGTTEPNEFNKNDGRAMSRVSVQTGSVRRSLRGVEGRDRRSILYPLPIEQSSSNKRRDSIRSRRDTPRHSIKALESVAGMGCIDKQHAQPVEGIKRMRRDVNVSTEASLCRSGRKGTRMTSYAETDSIHPRTPVSANGKKRMGLESATKSIDRPCPLTNTLTPDALVWVPFVRDALATNFYCVARLIKQVSSRRERWKVRTITAGRKRNGEFVGEDEAIVGVEQMCVVGLEGGDAVYRRRSEDITAGTFVSWREDEEENVLVRMRELVSKTIVTVKLKRLLIDRQLFQCKKRQAGIQEWG